MCTKIMKVHIMKYYAKHDTCSLQLRWMRMTAIEIFKILNGERPSYLTDLIQRKNSRYSFRYTNILDVPRVRTERYGKNSFRYSSVKIWNELPAHIRVVSSRFNDF